MTNPVIRGVVIYLFLLLVFRIAGKRSLAQATTFDLVLLLVVGEATQQALLGNDFSVTNALLLIITLVGVDRLTAFIKEKLPRFEEIAEGIPLIIVDNGKLLRERMTKVRVDENDIMEAARENGLERMEQIKYAVLERNGKISIIPLS